jgi:hypothetical protein
MKPTPPELQIKLLSDLEVKLLEKTISFATFELELPKYLLLDFAKEGVIFQDVTELTPHLYYATKAWIKEDGTPVEKRGRFLNTNLRVVELFHKSYETYKEAIDTGMAPFLARQLLCSANIVRTTSSASIVMWNDIVNRLLPKTAEYQHFCSKIKSLLNADT